MASGVVKSLSLALRVVQLGIGPVLWRTQDQKLLFALHLSDLLGVIVTLIHQHGVDLIGDRGSNGS